MRLNRFTMRMVALSAPEDGAGGAGAAGAAPKEAAKPESVLFPDEKKLGDVQDNKVKSDGDAGSGTGDGKQAKPEWKEYVADPAKSEAENAAAKAEHDKGKPADKADDPANKVPEDGKYVVMLPDGAAVDQEFLDALSPEFKEFGLTQAQAQRLADKFAATQAARGAKQSETWAATVQGWVDQAKADQELGGVKWDATVKTAVRAMDRVGTPALREYLEATGGGNHPEVIRAFARMGALISEDRPAAGGAGGAGKPADAAHLLFPNDVPKGS